MTMLELWGRKNAYNVQKVTWMLAELELEYVHHDVGSTPGDLDSEEFLAINPHARIPVLKDADAIIWESNSIVRYLGASFAAGTLWPEDALERSCAERWMDWEMSKLQPDFIDLFWGYYRTPSESRNHQAIATAQQRCARHFEQLDRQLESQPYLAGDSFTMGDIPCAVCLYRYFHMGLDVDRPAQVLSWYQRLAQRSAFADTIMTPFDELKGRVDY
jgi:glutathione S-transferase